MDHHQYLSIECDTGVCHLVLVRAPLFILSGLRTHMARGKTKRTSRIKTYMNLHILYTGSSSGYFLYMMSYITQISMGVLSRKTLKVLLEMFEGRGTVYLPEPLLS
jgi:hypothetical protein